jgi:hypothetical protein
LSEEGVEAVLRGCYRDEESGPLLRTTAYQHEDSLVALGNYLVGLLDAGQLLSEAAVRRCSYIHAYM